ncbi:MAG TPA: ABC transporter permease [Micromonosporaceae bacterium]|nr:ABC transporter permease [Micromonosporaceae bacterium]
MSTTTSTQLETSPAMPLRLIRSELLKIRTTSVWWLLGISALAAIALALAVNAWIAHNVLKKDPTQLGLSVEDAVAQADAAVQAANLYTSGQFFGLMFVMLIGILMVTNEFFHQTATTTFLTTPRRTTVIFGKLAAACLVGFGFWLATTLIDLAVGSIFLSMEGYGSQLGEWPVQRALLLNLLAYMIWTVLGIGIGTLITNQLGAVITASVAYLVGTQVIGLLFFLLANWLENEKIIQWQVIWPSIASQVMITPDLPNLPAWWVGALILIGYALVTGLIGILITRKRDIS